MKAKSKTNFIIDALMFLVIMAVSGTGFLRKYVLLSGREAKAIYGHNVNSYVLGIDKKGWADIHLYLGFILLGLLVLHIVFHWQVIKAMFRQLIQNQLTRQILFWVFVIASLVLLLFPFILQPQV